MDLLLMPGLRTPVSTVPGLRVCVCLVRKSCLNLCDPMDCSPPGSTALGILQPQILDWIAIPSPGDLPNPEIEPGSSEWQVDALLSYQGP